MLKRKRIAFVRSKVQNNELAALQKTIDARPRTLGHALSFSKKENPSKKYTAVTIIQQSAESHDVDRDALLLSSTTDARPPTLGVQK
jgi:hypothetical protein